MSQRKKSPLSLMQKSMGLSLLLIGCTTQPCKGINEKAEVTTPLQSMKTVKVAKHDGSLQCKEGSGLAVEEMQKQLGDIQVFSSTKSSDGRIRIALCGKPSDKFNVYEISDKDLAKALALDFKEWKPE